MALSSHSLFNMPLTISAIQPVRILIIDDDEEDFLIIKDLINEIPHQNFQIEWAMNYEQGLTALISQDFDIYFVDYHLGAKNGIDLLKEAIKNKCEKPIVLFTGQGNKQIDMEAMHLGAADYLVKSQVSSEQLDRCIRYSLEQAVILRRSRANELKFRNIFERTKDIIFIADQQLEFQNVNSAATDLFGFKKEELLNQHTSRIFVNPSDKKDILKILRKEKKVIDRNIDLLAKDKTIKNCLFSASFEIDEMGTPYIQGIIRDISILKKVEEIKMQSELLEVKGEAIRLLAHEVRNPLANIILSTEYLKTETNKENQEFLNIIKRNSNRINDLISELLDSNQYHKLNLQINPLQDIINEALKEVSDRIDLKKIKINLTFPAYEALALVDKDKMRIAITNILVNATEAMTAENGELSITILSKWNHHLIEIKDNGCGISEMNVEKLFQPYFTTKTTGLGLGLAATSAILQSHKAEIEVLSTPAIGTIFTIKVPSL
ncbi:MAG TPA: ATP-binding protein [Cyclobacteriaceae bacterium]|jgi:PAS domain S-box-containing protein|nr:ATP-binding protein [Cyclobacteriaceae bacterium]